MKQSRMGKLPGAAVMLPVALVGGWVMLATWGTAVSHDAATGWQEAGLDPSRLRERCPRRSANVSSLRAECAALALGQTLAPKESNREGVAASVNLPTGFFTELQAAIRGDDASGFDDIVLPWLQAHGAELDEFARALRDEPQPVFEGSRSVDGERVGPPRRAIARLNCMLVARAISLARAGDPESAKEMLDAARRLNADLWRDPWSGMIFSAAINASYQLAAARQLPEADAHWLETFVTGDSSAVVAAMALSAAEQQHWVVDDVAFQRALQLGDGSDHGLLTGRFNQRVRLMLVRPALRAIGAEESASTLELVNALRAADPCHLDPALVTPRVGDASRLEEFLVRSGWGIGLPRVHCPSVSGGNHEWGLVWARAVLAPRIELALTRRVLELKALRRKGELDASGLVRGAEIGLPCEEWSIRHDVLADGRLSVSLAIDLPWPQVLRERVFTSWTEHAASDPPEGGP